MKILIVEDEVLIAEDLKDNLNSFGYNEVFMAHDKNQGIKLIEDARPDLVLLDIRMENEMDGIHIAKFLNETNKIPFIYITSHSDLNMLKEIMATYPAGYITKPFKKADLLANIIRVTEHRDNETKIVFKDGYETVIMEENQLLYLESEGNYVMIYHSGGKRLIRQTMDSFYLTLNKERFFRVHRGYIVNLNAVVRFSKTELHIAGVDLPISRGSQAEFLQRMESLNR